jgi:hypothetical protein
MTPKPKTLSQVKSCFPSSGLILPSGLPLHLSRQPVPPCPPLLKSLVHPTKALLCPLQPKPLIDSRALTGPTPMPDHEVSGEKPAGRHPDPLAMEGTSGFSLTQACLNR